MSGSSVPVRRIDASPQVTRWRAERARQEGRRRHDRRHPDRPAAQDGPGRGHQYAWPADRQAIIAGTLKAAAFIAEMRRQAEVGGTTGQG